MLWERSVVEQRYDAVMEVVRDGLPVTVVAERYGVARQSVHAWLRRYRDGGLEGLADRSHRPSSCPHQMPAAVEARVCELRRAHPGWGPQRLRYELAREGTGPVAASINRSRPDRHRPRTDKRARSCAGPPGPPKCRSGPSARGYAGVDVGVPSPRPARQRRTSRPSRCGRARRARARAPSVVQPPLPAAPACA